MEERKVVLRMKFWNIGKVEGLVWNTPEEDLPKSQADVEFVEYGKEEKVFTVDESIELDMYMFLQETKKQFPDLYKKVYEEQ